MDISIDDLADTLAEELAGYSQEVTDDLKKEVKQVAKEMVAELKATSPRDSGDYASGWTSTTEREGRNTVQVRVYNRKKPTLTHPLENGHAKVNGGRVEGKAHIGPAEQAAEKRLENKVVVMVK